MPGDTDVLIVGAGPTGLVLALFLTRLGVRVRLIDKTAEPGTTSRAIVIHARTLEFFHQVGIADACVAGGLRFDSLNLWVGGRHAGSAKFDDLGPPFSRFSFVLSFPQDAQERLLVDELARLGVHVERRTELASFDLPRSGGADAKLRSPDGTVEPVHARYVAGCDGAHSTVRQQLRVGLPGGDYADLFYVADIEGTGPTLDGAVHLALDDADFLGVFPLKRPGTGRLVGAVRRDAGNQAEVTWDDVSTRVIEHLKLDVRTVHWFSTYHVHHRVATAFRHGPAFLLGDAAHIHSPVGGQGMNTGVGDAVNLAWKLAGVLQERIDPAVLDSYEPERIAFARRLVATTDRAFEFVTARGPLAKRVRLTVVPALLPRLFGVRAFRRLAFRILSQTAIQYRASALSAGKAGPVRGGDRLPWVDWADSAGNRADNYQHFSSLDWQLHCYCDASPAVRAACEARGLALHAFAWRPAMKRAGLRRNAIYLVRPDAYVALVEPRGDIGVLERYLDEHGITGIRSRAGLLVPEYAR